MRNSKTPSSVKCKTNRKCPTFQYFIKLTTYFLEKTKCRRRLPLQCEVIRMSPPTHQELKTREICHAGNIHPPISTLVLTNGDVYLESLCTPHNFSSSCNYEKVQVGLIRQRNNYIVLLSSWQFFLPFRSLRLHELRRNASQLAAINPAQSTRIRNRKF